MKIVILFFTTIYLLLIVFCVNAKVEEMINQPHYVSKSTKKYQRFQFRITRYPNPDYPNDLGHISIDVKPIE